MYILNNLFINVLIIISSVSLNSYFFREKAIGHSSRKLDKVFFSFTGLVMASALMFYSIKIPNTTTIIDLRFFPLVYVFYMAGIIPTIITGIGIIIYRFSFHGIDHASIIAAITIACYICAYQLVNKYHKYKLISYYCFSIIIFMISLALQIKDLYDLMWIYLIYIPISLMTYIIMITLNNHLKHSNELFRKYKEESSKDFLTGLYNTRQYDLLFNSISKNIVVNDQDLAYLIIDIDFFKKVNDTHGHDAGDQILTQLAQVIRVSCGSTEIISRIGGEEFTVLSLGANLDGARILAEKIRLGVESHQFYINEHETIAITVSIGISHYPNLTKDVNKLKELADIALYKSKQNGRNRVSC